MELSVFFRENPRVALAFSGGVDSAYLLYAGAKAGAHITAYYVKSEFQPAFELEDAKRLADSLRVPLRILELSVLDFSQIRENGSLRCYYCKKQIFQRILQAAEADGYSLVIDGTNASDPEADRPGMRALKEMEVRSPLRECGLTKDMIRKLSKQAGLFTWNKPAYACLATRIPTGVPIEKEFLEKVERAEAFLTEQGFSNLRVRILHGHARIQLPEEQWDLLLQKAQEIRNRLSEDFQGVLLDLYPREKE